MNSLSALPYFLTYFAASVVLLAIFLVIYTRITRHDEWSLVRSGNPAAATSVSGAAIGFSLPLASVIAHSVSFVDLLIWSIIAMVVQLLSYFLVRAAIPDMTTGIEQGHMTPAILLGSGAIVMGIINAACLTY